MNPNMSRSWSLGLCLATFLAPAAFGQQASTPSTRAQDAQPQEAPRNMAAVLCNLNEASLNRAAGSWARTLDVAQDQEAEIARLKAEIDTLKEGR